MKNIINIIIFCTWFTCISQTQSEKWKFIKETIVQGLFCPNSSFGPDEEIKYVEDDPETYRIKYLVITGYEERELILDLKNVKDVNTGDGKLNFARSFLMGTCEYEVVVMLKAPIEVKIYEKNKETFGRHLMAKIDYDVLAFNFNSEFKRDKFMRYIINFFDN